MEVGTGQLGILNKQDTTNTELQRVSELSILRQLSFKNMLNIVSPLLTLALFSLGLMFQSAATQFHN
jgi:hypothetical protein